MRIGVWLAVGGICMFALGLPLTPIQVHAGSAGLSAPVAAGVEVSAAKRKKPSKASKDPGYQIACNRFGCQRVSRRCTIVPERAWDGTPTGQDALICP
jgi:hypothetical protein